MVLDCFPQSVHCFPADNRLCKCECVMWLACLQCMCIWVSELYVYRFTSWEWLFTPQHQATITEFGMTPFSMYTVFQCVVDHCILWCCEHLRLVLFLVIVYSTMECYLLIGKCVYTIVWFHRVRWWEVWFPWDSVLLVPSSFTCMYRMGKQPCMWQVGKAMTASLRSYWRDKQIWTIRRRWEVSCCACSSSTPAYVQWAIFKGNFWPLFVGKSVNLMDGTYQG